MHLHDLHNIACKRAVVRPLPLINSPTSPGEGVLPYMGSIGICGPKWQDFSAVLVINGVSIFVYSS